MRPARTLLIASILSASLASGLTSSANADESFICENGVVITVVSGTRTSIQQTDPCRKISLLSGFLPPIPARHPNRVVADTAEATNSGASAESGTLDADQSQQPKAAIERPSGTYRRVFVINAGSADRRWFDHTR